MVLEDTAQPANITKPKHLHAGEGRRLRVVTELVTIKATDSETGDTFALFETETPPGGGSPAHTQRYEDEAFYVLEGSYTFLIGEEEIVLGPGGYVYVPRGTVHGYANPGSERARMLVLITPGGVQEQFLDEVGDEADRPAWEPDVARVLAVAQKYGVEFRLPEEHSDQVTCD